MKNKSLWWTVSAAAIILLVLIIWKVSSKPKVGNSSDSNTNSSNDQSVTPAATPSGTDTASQQMANTIGGMLQISDNSAKGNLMVVTSTQTLYIRTGRDFSALVGKNVVAHINGTTTNFTLGDITAQ